MTKNLIKKISIGIIISIAFSGIAIGVINYQGNRTIQKNNEAKKIAADQKAKDQKTKEDKKKATYVSLLESTKTYEEMSGQERTDVSELLTNWDKQDQDFKDKYKDEKEFIEKSKTEIVAKWKAAEETKKLELAAKKAEEEKVAYDTGITYEQLARTPDDYKGKKAKFTGKVVQLVEGNGENDLRIAVDGDYNNILYVTYDPKIMSTRILENDYVTIKGTSSGIYSYKSTLGKKISVPLMQVDQINLNK